MPIFGAALWAGSTGATLRFGAGVASASAPAASDFPESLRASESPAALPDAAARPANACKRAADPTGIAGALAANGSAPGAAPTAPLATVRAAPDDAPFEGNNGGILPSRPRAAGAETFGAVARWAPPLASFRRGSGTVAPPRCAESAAPSCGGRAASALVGGAAANTRGSAIGAAGAVDSSLSADRPLGKTVTAGAAVRRVAKVSFGVVSGSSPVASGVGGSAGSGTETSAMISAAVAIGAGVNSGGGAITASASGSGGLAAGISPIATVLRRLRGVAPSSVLPALPAPLRPRLVAGFALCSASGAICGAGFARFLRALAARGAASTAASAAGAAGASAPVSGG